MARLIRHFVQVEGGATAIEYGRIAAGHLGRNHRCGASVGY